VVSGRSKLGMIIRSGQVLPSPSTILISTYLQRFMDVLKNLIGDECYVFIDNVIGFSKSAEEHASMLEHVLERFDKANLQLHPLIGFSMSAEEHASMLEHVLERFDKANLQLHPQ